MGDSSNQEKTASAEGPAIVCRGLVKQYADLRAVNGIDLRIERGRCLGLLGPNGAGKTTTVEMLVGLRTPDDGFVQILGKSWSVAEREIRERIGVQLQETRLPDKNTVFEMIRLFRSLYRKGKDPEQIVELIGLEEKRNTRLEKLSGGQKQRLALGCAVVHEPELLFLDEPTTGLDPQARRTVWSIVESFKNSGGTVLLTTHYMDEAEHLADELVILDHGKILRQGTPRQIVDALQGDSILEFRVDGEPADDHPLQDELRQCPGVLSVQQRTQTYTLGVTQIQEALPAVMERVRAHRWTIMDLDTHRPTLDDVFVSLTGRHLEDDQDASDIRTDSNEVAASPS